MDFPISNQFLFLASGLVLFLFGMIKLSGKMQKIFSVRIREYIKHLVKKPLYGVGMGTVATALFQSSSAVTVMVVGVVGAGLISFYNSLGMILGADIGTTFTAQLVAWKITAVAPAFIVVGGLLWIMARKEKIKVLGEAIFYFGLMFFGLNLISQVAAPLKDNQMIVGLFKETANPFVGIALGLVFTAVVQASSIPISILVILSQQGLVTIEGALPIVLGANIGTTATALLASLGSNVNGKRAAFAHFLFKFLGVMLVLPFLTPFISFLGSLSQNPAQQIATSHLLFSLLIVAVFIFFLKPFSSLVKKAIPGKAEVLPIWPEWLDKKVTKNPPLALEAAKKELKRQALLAHNMFRKSLQILEEFQDSKFRDVSYIELVVDNLQSEIPRFLNEVSKNNLKEEETVKLFHYSAMVDDIERMADHATNIAKLARIRNKYRAPFSDLARQEIREIGGLVDRNFEEAISLIENPHDTGKIKSVVEREDVVDEKVLKSKTNHIRRFYKGLCYPDAGPIFIDVLINLERISDHCENITEYAQALNRAKA